MSHYDDYNEKDVFIYLLTCSRRSLGSFLLSRYDGNQRLTKELMLRLEEMVDRIAQIRAEIHVANLLREHGEEIVSRLASSPQRLPAEPVAEPQRILPKPQKRAKA